MTLIAIILFLLIVIGPWAIIGWLCFTYSWLWLLAVPICLYMQKSLFEYLKSMTEKWSDESISPGSNGQESVGGKERVVAIVDTNGRKKTIRNR